MIVLVYPSGPRKAAPWSIGNHIGDALSSRGHSGITIDWDAQGSVPEGGAGDVLIGHPNPVDGPFLRMLYRPWAARIAIMPWAPEPWLVEWCDSWMHAVDHAFLISGPRWESSIPQRWRYKVTRLDMAIDVDDYPPLERPFHQPGQRRCLYIGCTVPAKGTDWLEALIRQTPEARWGHIGPGRVAGAEEHGYVPLETAEGRDIAAQYDLLVMPGRYDANPTTVLEAMALGLVPVCTQGCGWDGDDVWLLPWEVDLAAQHIRHLLTVDDLHDYCDGDREQVQNKYNWSAFTAPIVSMVERFQQGCKSNSRNAVPVFSM